MKKLTEIQKKKIKKTIAREFLFILGGFLLWLAITYIWSVFRVDNGYSDMPEIIFAVLSSLLFPLRYIIYATIWSIKQLKN